jgi:hypothetical protein
VNVQGPSQWIMPKRGTGTAITPETTTDHTAPFRGLFHGKHQIQSSGISGQLNC